jgi:exopolyphosphatase / guanosine-5'-triphosphate,3'-diphosphate pyrophosphatase
VSTGSDQRGTNVPRKVSTRVAVVDVGTNTTRLFVADLEEGRVVAQVERISRVTRLGAGVDLTGRLGQEGLEREYSVIEDFRDMIRKHRPDRAVAVMTSAVRDAENGRDFADLVSDRYGFDVHVLTGDEEAQLTYLGATDDLDPADTKRVLVLDIGGGSTELVIGHGEELDFHVSTQAGVVRQADRHITNDPPTDAELTAVAEDVRETLTAAVPAELLRTGVDLAIAVAGTPTSLAAIAQELDPYDPSRVHGYQLTAAVRDSILTRLQAMTLDERKEVPGLHPDRAIAILPGIVILREVMDLFGLDSVQVSEHDILRGAAMAFAAKPGSDPRGSGGSFRRY